MTPEELFERLDGTVHEDTQVGERGVDPTAREATRANGEARPVSSDP